MKNIFKITRFIFYVLLLCIFVSCTRQYCKYNVWISGNGMNLEFSAYSFKDSCGYLVFLKKDSTIIICPKERLNRIIINSH